MSDKGVVRIMCPNLGCQRILAVPPHARGKLVRCKSCGMTVRVPSGSGDAAGTAEQNESAA